MAEKTYKDTPETLLAAILAMQNKLLNLRDEFETAELTYDVEMGDGRIITRANPFVQEYMAMVKDFGIALKKYKEIASNDDEAEDAFDAFINKFEVLA